MEGVILLVVAVGGLGAFLAGVVLLFLYFRSSRADDYYDDDEAVMYGNLVQCRHCGYMNPVDSAACLNCRRPLPHLHGYAPQAPYPQAAPSYSAPAPQHPTVPPASGYSPPPALGATAPSSAPAYHPPTVSPDPPPAPSSGAVPGMPQAWLEGVGGAMMGHRAILTQADTLVGRSTQCDVQVYDPKVSRKHFRIRYANGAFFVQDQQSSRGTRINGEQVTAQRVNNGDRIDIGDSSLIFHCE